MTAAPENPNTIPTISRLPRERRNWNCPKSPTERAGRESHGLHLLLLRDDYNNVALRCVSCPHFDSQLAEHGTETLSHLGSTRGMLFQSHGIHRLDLCRALRLTWKVAAVERTVRDTTHWNRVLFSVTKRLRSLIDHNLLYITVVLSDDTDGTLNTRHHDNTRTWTLSAFGLLPFYLKSSRL